MNSSDTPYHDLTKIRGIGEARQKILHRHLNINYYDDLIKLDIDNALQLLRKKSEAVSRDMLQSWVEEAKQLSKREQTRSLENGWQAAATFVVDYQEKVSSNEESIYRTTVHHIQPDNTRFWETVDSIEYHQWIKEQLEKTNLINAQKNKNTLGCFSALIKEVSFRGALNKNILSGEIELLLYIESNDNEMNNVNCNIRCLLKNQHQKEIIEFTSSSRISKTSKDHYFSASIDGIAVAPGEYFLWVTVVLDSPRSIPHFKAIKRVTVP